MTTPRRRSDPEKFRRYRAAKRARGLRQIRLWVPDLRNPEVLAEIARQGRVLRGAPEQAEATEFLTSHLLQDD
jgi:hypothetical protein